MVEEWIRIEVILKKVDAEYLAEVCKTFGISPNDYIAYIIHKELYGTRKGMGK